MDNRHIISLFLDHSSLKDHIEYQEKRYDVYVSNLILLTLEYKVKLTILKRAMILSAALYLRNMKLAAFLLDQCCHELPVVLKTCQILDSRRYCAQMKKKTDKIKNVKRLAAHKSIIANFEQMSEGYPLSLTKSKIKFIKKNWINRLSYDELELMVLQFSTNYWKKLANFLHLKDSDFNDGIHSWFLSYVFSKDPKNAELSEDKLIYKCNHLNKDNIYEVVKDNNIPYAYLSSDIHYYKLLNDDVKKVFLDQISFEDLLKNWEDFNKPELREELIYKLENSDINDLPYGELIKRLLELHNNLNNHQELYNSLINVAQNKLDNYNAEINSPIVVLGDASSSMDIAIRTSTIIASILCNLFDAKLHMFRTGDEHIENVPKTVEEVINLSEVCKASGATAPAASLYPYLERKEVVKTFIIVTDEIENNDADGKWLNKDGSYDKNFANTFKKYYDNVYPAKLVFVSFLQDNRDGHMVRELKKVMPNINENLVQFRLNKYKPDLRKLDDLLNVLALETDLYQEQCEMLKDKLNSSGFMDIHKYVIDKDLMNTIENVEDTITESMVLEITI